MRLVFATTNQDKLAEVVAAARPLGLAVEGLMEFGSGSRVPSIPETGLSYYDNARRKALGYAAWTGLPCVADDAGLEVHSLNQLPGVYTARFGFKRLRDMVQAGCSYSATFRCCVCYCDGAERTVAVEGCLDGALTFPREATQPQSSLPYSHFFTPNGESLSLAALVASGAYPSHRVRAITKLFSVLDFTRLEVGRG